ncbi:hypothetical protein YPPY12_1169, partial [Yersinia pestis PY-12]
MKHPALQQARN